MKLEDATFLFPVSNNRLIEKFTNEDLLQDAAK